MSGEAPDASVAPVAVPLPAADDPNQVEKVLLGGGELWLTRLWWMIN